MSNRASSSPKLDDLLNSWRRSLVADGKSEATIYNSRAAEAFSEHIGPIPVREITRGHVDDFLATLRESGNSESTVATRYRALQQLFRWLVDEAELDVSPMAKMRAPRVPEQPVPVISEEEEAALFAVCRGNDFEARRDTALFHFLLATGARAAEVIGLQIADVDLDARTATVLGKGRRRRVLHLTAELARDLDRYLRVRTSHTFASDTALWLGKRGKLTTSGLAQILTKRCRAAGIGKLHPHQFRHTYAHRFLSNGGTEGSLMRNAGWKNRDMINRYGASAADARARREQELFAPRRIA